MEGKKVKILIAGKVSSFASELSSELFGFFEENQTDFQVKHAFSSTELFYLMSNEDFNVVLIDKNIKNIDPLMTMFLDNEETRPFWMFLFDSEKMEEFDREFRIKIFKTFKGGS